MITPDSPDLDPSWQDRVRRKLVEWYDRGHRDLPWRRSRDPYRILVSEMMLVQTTVAAVVPYFERFLQQFPTLRDLARADETDVVKAWEGLGYYRRARQLHAAAKIVCRDHGGVIPEDAEAILALPGVGQYIAGAVLSFAFNRPAPVVEANTQRVLARLLAWNGDLAKAATQKRLWEAAERLVPERGAGQFNQALMELGATVCTPRQPMCLVCPVSSECRARKQGVQDQLPIKAAKPAPLIVEEACALVRREGKLLVIQRGPGGLWEGFWEFPTIHISGVDPAGRCFEHPVDLDDGVFRLTGVRVKVGSIAHSVTFGVTKHRVTLRAYSTTDLGGIIIPYKGFVDAKFARTEEIRENAMGSAVRKLANWAIENG